MRAVEYLATLAPLLDAGDKSLVVQATWLVGAANGELSGAECATLASIGDALGMSATEREQAIAAARA